MGVSGGETRPVAVLEVSRHGPQWLQQRAVLEGVLKGLLSCADCFWLLVYLGNVVPSLPVPGVVARVVATHS